MDMGDQFWGEGMEWEAGWKRLIARMKVRVCYPSISCDGAVSVFFTVGTAEGRMLKSLHLGTPGVIVWLRA